MRVGIATGIVVVGTFWIREAQERGVVGDTPNLAARLQGLAAPDSVVIAEGTRRLIGELFELGDLGPQDLKGVAAARAFRRCGRAPRAASRRCTPTADRAGRPRRRNRTLLRRWTRAKAGEGQVVLLSGEAGIGKSRLTAALLERLTSEPHIRLRYFCSPQHTDSALHPIIAQLERAAGLTRDDDAEDEARQARRNARATSTSREDAALSPRCCRCRTTAVIRPSTPPAAAPADDAPGADRPDRSDRTAEAAADDLRGRALDRSSSLEALGRLVERIRRMRALLFVTPARSSRRPGSAGPRSRP